MAKGNLFQGMARGKVGDVVFYRMNGVQMSRVRNRAPKNPRSIEQLYQRSIIATVMKFYSAGKEIFDHSFQGYTVGEGCMRRFNSVNARILRAQIVSDVDENKPLNQQIGRVVGPRTTSPTPINFLQISEGTLTNTMFTFTSQKNPSNNFYAVNINKGGLTFNETTTVNQWLKKIGVYAGDIFTFVCATIDTNTNAFVINTVQSPFSYQYQTVVDWVRFIVKSDIPDTLMTSNATFADIFDIEQNGIWLQVNANTAITDDGFIEPIAGYEIATMGCIRSRLDVDLRSTEVMYPMTATAWGIPSGLIITAWQEFVNKIGTSELILEGGDAYNATTMNIEGEENTPIIPAPVDENPVPIPARHRGSRNEKK